MSAERPVIGGFYRHFKNKLYQVLQIAVHSETGEELVVYQALYGDFKVYARPLENFMSDVDHEKYPDVTQKKRFVRVNLIKAENTEQPKTPGDNETKVKSEVANAKAAYTSPVNTLPEKEKEIQREESERRQEGADPRLLQFLEAESSSLKWKIYTGFEEDASDHLLYAVAASMDLDISGASKDEIKDIIRDNLSARMRYEKLRAEL